MRRYGFDSPVSFAGYYSLGVPVHTMCGGAYRSVFSTNYFFSDSGKAKSRFSSGYFRCLFPSFLAFNGAMIYQSLPLADSYAHQQFVENTAGENAKIQNYVRWSAILAATGIFEKMSRYDLPFHFTRSFVEHYLEFWYHTVFHENTSNRVYFRGEYKKDADSLLKEGKHRIPLPYSLCSGEFSLPYVKDPTLEPDGVDAISAHPNGFTKGVISLTSSLEVTQVYGGAESVLVVVPSGRVAPVAHHALKDAQNFQYEYICGGVFRDDILLIAYRNVETQEVSEVRFNPSFSGAIDKLELDFQMQEIINAIPDNDLRKAQLQARLKPGLDYRDSYDELVAPDQEKHSEALKQRLSHIAKHGFKGKPWLRSLHKTYHAAKFDVSDYVFGAAYVFSRHSAVIDRGNLSCRASSVSAINSDLLSLVETPDAIASSSSLKRKASVVSDDVNILLSPQSVSSVVSSVSDTANVLLSPKRRSTSFRSPSRTYSSANSLAQEDMLRFRSTKNLSQTTDSNSDDLVVGVVQSKRHRFASSHPEQSKLVDDKAGSQSNRSFSFDVNSTLNSFKFGDQVSSSLRATSTSPVNTLDLYAFGNGSFALNNRNQISPLHLLSPVPLNPSDIQDAKSEGGSSSDDSDVEDDENKINKKNKRDQKSESRNEVVDFSEVSPSISMAQSQHSLFHHRSSWNKSTSEEKVLPDVGV